MKSDKIAAQLYTLRDHLKSPEQVVKTLRHLRRIGYTAVQLAGLCPIETAELARILSGEGLFCCATHENSATILDHPEAIAEKLHILGCTYAAYPYPVGVDTWNMRSIRTLASRLESAGRILLQAGKVLTYHNHEIEFARIKGKTVLERIYDETRPELLHGELDTHWIQAGGGNPTSWCRRLSGRLPLIHLQDYVVANDGHRRFSEVGSGNLEWESIIPAADEAGCQWYVVEQAGDWVDNDPFKSLKISLEFLRPAFAA
jgi:sugar phosphate isomerase/epimerase